VFVWYNFTTVLTIFDNHFVKFLQISPLTMISDLSQYQIEIYFDGNPDLDDATVIPLNSVSLDICEPWYVADDGERLDFLADQYTTATLFDGNDAIVLRRKSDNEIMDIIGQVGVDPGIAWSSGGVSTINQSICRKRTVTSGVVANPSIPFDPSLEWISFPIDIFFSQMDETCKCYIDRPPTPAPTAPLMPLDVFIHEIQGKDATSPLVDALVRVEAIVIGDFQNRDADVEKNLGGFWIQEEDEDADDDETTSEGIFVIDPDTFVDVNLGDKVVVVGIVKENFGNTVIDADSVVITSTTEILPSYTEIELPMNLEQVEGMLVEFKQDLIIIEQFNLDRFSEVLLYAGSDRPYQYTQLNTPSKTGLEAYTADLDSLTITYEDGRDGSTNDVDYFDGFSPYSTATAPRMGDVIKKLKGVVDYKFGNFRVRSIIDGSVTVQRKNIRPQEPPEVGSGLRIASFNVLNYFITLGERGAEDKEEFGRQQQKLVTALAGLDADIFGLIELENNFPAVLIDLVTALNARVGSGVYSYVNPGRQKVGTEFVSYSLSFLTLARDF
jgi:predicted extracellular nuclease